MSRSRRTTYLGDHVGMELDTRRSNVPITSPGFLKGQRHQQSVREVDAQVKRTHGRRKSAPTKIESREHEDDISSKNDDRQRSYSMASTSATPLYVEVTVVRAYLEAGLSMPEL